MAIFLEILQDNMAPEQAAFAVSQKNAWPLISVRAKNLYEGPLDDIYIEV